MSQLVFQQLLQFLHCEGPYIVTVWTFLTEVSWFSAVETGHGGECLPAYQVYVYRDTRRWGTMGSWQRGRTPADRAVGRVGNL